MLVVGKKLGEFKNTSNEIVKYARLYVTYEDDKTEGLIAEMVKISVDLFDLAKVGDEIEVMYNKFGKVTDIFVHGLSAEIA